MIVGTAGHIDHGKTTLVRALTGVETDRLPEEKKRGISIELGYAYLDAPDDARIGFIDVPGHERLVHTMVAGASGIDYALLLVAADDGPMPQTHEHLAVLSLLGIVVFGAIVAWFFTRLTGDIRRLEAHAHRIVHGGRGVDLQGLEVLKGKESFCWAGRYHYDMNTRDTLETRLNVLLDLDPKLSPEYCEAKYLMLGNLDPKVQGKVLDLSLIHISEPTRPY